MRIGKAKGEMSVTTSGRTAQPYTSNLSEVDYLLSRSLYENEKVAGKGDYRLGAWCVKPYINTLVSYVGLPKINSANPAIAETLNAFIAQYRQGILENRKMAYIDGRSYLELRYEKDSGFRLRVIPREMLKGMDRDYRTGELSKVVLEYDYVWVDSGGNSQTVRIKEEISPTDTLTTYLGTLPPGAPSIPDVWQNPHGFIPIFERYNEKEAYNADGRAEIGPTAIFIEAYHKTFSKLLENVHSNATPKIVVKTMNIATYILNTFGKSKAEAIQRGDVELDYTQIGALHINKDDDVKYLQATGVAADLVTTLQYLFYCIIDTTMPEYLYGNGMATTNASVREQSPTWERKIDRKRTESEGYDRQLFDAYLRMWERVNGRTLGVDRAYTFEWPEVTSRDEQAYMTAVATFATALGTLLDRKTIAPADAFEAIKPYILTLKEWPETQSGIIKNEAAFRRFDQIDQRIRDGNIDVKMADEVKEILAMLGGKA